MGRSEKRARAQLDRMLRVATEIKCDGKTYRMTPLGLREMAQLERWASEYQFKLLEEKVAALCARDLNAEVRNRIVDSLVAETEKRSRDLATLTGMLASVAGIRQGIILSFRVAHPKISEDEVDHIIDTVGFNKLREVFENESQLTADEVKN